jgi:hypothetical protein
LLEYVAPPGSARPQRRALNSNERKKLSVWSDEDPLNFGYFCKAGCEALRGTVLSDLFLVTLARIAGLAALRDGARTPLLDRERFADRLIEVPQQTLGHRRFERLGAERLAQRAQDRIVLSLLAEGANAFELGQQDVDETHEPS